MGGKRNVSQSDVKKSSTKVGKGIQALVAKDEQLEFQAGLAELGEKLKQNKSLLKKCQVVLKSEAPPSYDALVQFDPELANKTVGKVPLAHLRDSYLPETLGIPVPTLRALHKADSKVPGALSKVFMRAHCVTADGAFGPIIKSEWNAAYAQRFKAVNFSLSQLKWNEHHQIDWQASGHFTLLPPLPEGLSNPADHVYVAMSFMGVSVTLGNKFQVTGVNSIEANWNHMGATVVDPSAPWVRIPCWSYFAGTDIWQGLRPLTFEKQLLSIKDAPIPSSSACSLGAGCKKALALTNEPPVVQKTSSENVQPASSHEAISSEIVSVGVEDQVQNGASSEVVVESVGEKVQSVASPGVVVESADVEAQAQSSSSVLPVGAMASAADEGKVQSGALPNDGVKSPLPDEEQKSVSEAGQVQGTLVSPAKVLRPLGIKPSPPSHKSQRQQQVEEAKKKMKLM
mmetsp:Transcript_66099/g.104632  ORF Transcript_66099/g.104632 Transcript_66099/m.104632 type:complete len:456 (-) Transcript_66099:115-1482(-)|eukprot:CAMPEP_0169184786 /NCGR_PEP_ID=MMETSP1016-20121227/1412_1 /TAXON_ID=342587 /ORGANISM="Karlodinium micrum, Strain CCMP2283" /LENGTH=455 /DNA_ID=CAMNT_0009260373 /DNA_START=59 /DNA_END=1426 /DNA_ORIENTATION=-